MRQTPDRGKAAMDDYSVFFSTDIGLRRTENQDQVAAIRVNVNPSIGHSFIIIALSDGMGGMRDGKLCANKAIASFFYSAISNRHLDAEKRLELAAHAANNAVGELFNGTGGATLSVVCIGGDNKINTLNVGDSRIYATVEKPNREVIRLTVDDSLEELVGGHGKELLQFIGMGEGIKPHINNIHSDVKNIVITSDGIHYVDQGTFYKILINSNTPSVAIDRLSALARWCGSPDNASLSIVDVGAALNSLQDIRDAGVEIADSFTSTNFLWIRESSLDEEIAKKNENFPYKRADILDKNCEDCEVDPRHVDANENHDDEVKNNIPTEKKADHDSGPKQSPQKRKRKPRAPKEKKVESSNPQLLIEIDTKLISDN
ncbi:serine/threonine phosphatase PrpC [Aquitalea magnusonii]|uniref:Serine/threonine phosphatase PrpC n=2 Tax=Aquitalea magnusonii TaxID=332411 RepID=A0A3G9GHC3_9NEIS|nr:serine/threonine phosphatase PrpC [Aquitalea magnusonii]